MALRDQISAGARNAFAARPVVDRVSVERTLRRANRSLGRSLGRIEWAGSLEAYIRRSADLLLEGWTLDDDCPLSPPKHLYGGKTGRSNRRLSALAAIERRLWEDERAAHSTARLSRSKRLPVYLNAIDAPSTRRPCGAARAARRGDGGGDAGGTGASVRRGEVLAMGR